MAGRVELRFRFLRADAARWVFVNPVLAAGEPGFERDTNRLKIGDGVQRWNELDYLVDQDQVDVMVQAALITALAGLQVLTPLQAELMIDTAIAELTFVTPEQLSTSLGQLNFVTSSQMSQSISTAIGSLTIPTSESISSAISSAIAQLVIPTAQEIDSKIATAIGQLVILSESEVDAKISTAIDALVIPPAYSGPTIYVQETEPATPPENSLWIW